eukprot:TRINITY_DN432_c3_g2_i1.p1 TRINITY_DN432_c3_g2~~TRINITY_DN432_c3_g2_i1.p1  ORF type:complete len:272 (+),score=109.32 TRINITY_DN432_c3_g2_i1:110-817(+)
MGGEQTPLIADVSVTPVYSPFPGEGYNQQQPAGFGFVAPGFAPAGGSRIEIHKKAVTFSNPFGHTAIKNYFPEDYSILLENRISREEFETIIRKVNNKIYKRAKPLRTVGIVTCTVMAFCFCAFFLFMMGATAATILLPGSLYIPFYFAVPAIAFFVFVFGFVILCIPITIFLNAHMAKAEGKIAKYLDRVNRETFLQRGVQWRVETTADVVLVGRRGRLQQGFKLVIDMVQHHH